MVLLQEFCATAGSGKLEVFRSSEYTEDQLMELGTFDLVMVESPNNPYLEVKDLEAYQQLKSPGGVLAVDATMASPLGRGYGS